jgi:hypothetical protein
MKVLYATICIWICLQNISTQGLEVKLSKDSDSKVTGPDQKSNSESIPTPTPSNSIIINDKQPSEPAKETNITPIIILGDFFKQFQNSDNKKSNESKNGIEKKQKKRRRRRRAIRRRRYQKSRKAMELGAIAGIAGGAALAGGAMALASGAGDVKMLHTQVDLAENEYGIAKLCEKINKDMDLMLVSTDNKLKNLSSYAKNIIFTNEKNFDQNFDLIQNQLMDGAAFDTGMKNNLDNEEENEEERKIKRRQRKQKLMQRVKRRRRIRKQKKI